MSIGIIGYQGSGKSTLLEWLTGVSPDPSLAHSTQHAMATVPDSRMGPLREIYQPKKVTLAAIDLVDTPGLSRKHEQSGARLGMIREASSLVVVVAAFDGSDAQADLQSLEDDLLIADLEIVTGRVGRLRESVKKPRPDRQQQQEELEALEPLLASLEAGNSLQQLELTPEQKQATRSFQLFSEKPRLVVINTPDDDANPEGFVEKASASTGLSADCFSACSLSLQLELSKMEEAERTAFCEEMGVKTVDRAALLRKIMDVAGQMVFYTVGPKEVRTWLINKGATAVEAAGSIHTDLARGFVRAETFKVDDLIRLGGERELKAQNLVRHEPKGYVVQEGEVVHILANA